MTFALLIAATALAAVSFGVYFSNRPRYAPPRGSRPDARVSVLVPARDEETRIGGLIESVLADPGCGVELVVLDDHSSDRTAEIVSAAAERDARVRLVRGDALPAGWCGKQFACWQLAHAATEDRWLFLDADVRLEPGAVAAAVAEMEVQRVDLLSGVPRQEYSGLLDRLLIPLIHFVLLGYLPLGRAARSASPAYSAGCGQFFLTTRRAYAAAGGHEAVRASMHDGLMLPTEYRRAGLRTGLSDLTAAARCRMYDRDADVWPGLSKNAVEGIASPGRIGPFTVLLFGGHVLPWLLLPWQPMAGVACGLSLLPRLDAAARFRHPWLSAVLHPVAVATFLIVQWSSLAGHLLGRRPRWRGRGVEQGSGAATLTASREADELTAR